MSKNTAVFGLYDSEDHAERAVDALIGGGFESFAISVLLPDGESTHAFGHEKRSKLPEGAMIGAIGGGILGSFIGACVAAGSMSIPGLGALVTAGPVIAALAGLGVVGTLGGLIGAGVGVRIPEYEARRYTGPDKEGGTLLSVHCESATEVSRAQEVLYTTLARGIAAASEMRVSKPSAPRPLKRGLYVRFGTHSGS